MGLCPACKGLDVVAAVHRAQKPPGSPHEDEDGDGHGVVGGWHALGRDVLASASTCQLCALVCQGWRKWREKVIREAVVDDMFDESNPPKDLRDDISKIGVYVEGRTAFSFERRERYSAQGEKWNCVLAIACTSVSPVSSFDVHDQLVAELRITHASDDDDGDDSAELAGFGLGITVGEDPMSPSSVATVKDWLHHCVLEHEPCRAGIGAASLPTRIIDVDDGLNSDTVFLRESTDGADARYVALSHCWGTSRPLCLTSATLETHKQGISIRDLPRTFKDAVTIVQTLGLRYIWIDSLCIVQDDAEDWRREAGRMAGVYRNAHLVLSAARAGSDEEGFLSIRPRPDHVTLTTRGADKPLTLTLLPPGPPWKQDSLATHILADESLSHRAWCLQERYLARRILHYGTQQMIWECGELIATEDGDFAPIAKDQLGRIARSAALATTVFNSRTRDVDGETEAPGHRHTEWHAMIEDYTSRAITKDSDRLPALLGLRVALESGLDDQYLSGIWLGGLLEGLAWCAASRDSPLARPEGFAGPSWTWASVKGPVQFPMYSWFDKRARWKVQSTFEPLADYAGHSEEPNDDTPAAAGPQRLELLAPVVPVRGARPRAKTPPESGAVLGNAPDRSAVAGRSFCFRARDGHGAASKTREFWIDGGFDVEGEGEGAAAAVDASELHLVFLARLPFIFEDSDFLEHRFGLLVVRQGETTATTSGGSGGGCYRRVGYVDGCLLRRSLLLRKETVAAWPWHGGDMYAPEINALAPDPLRLERDRVTLI
ncbi:putative HET domain-containing protein [Rosellinia necatrix]|uniref:Putative HET domain-containing protein n=1 Tax=Rosellinia necatrix TaxID=77044 RepID=A0A1S7UKP4_ROSNE|nr:putative HET domain-containing protein [Rosellinia necatrix]